MADLPPESSEYKTALAAVREAADLCRRVQGSLDPERLQKEDRSPVTVADYGSQALVCSRLRAAFPSDPIIAEEDAGPLRGDSGTPIREAVVREVRRLRADASEADILEWIDYGEHDHHVERYWTLDPIDGTKGFLRGDQYAVALALIENGRVSVAALACPNLDLGDGARGAVVAAAAGGGSWVYDLDRMEVSQRAAVSHPGDRSSYRFCESVESRHTSHESAREVAEALGIAADALRLDSQAKYAVVATGTAEIYMRLPSARRYLEYIWDHAAGSLVVQEAGGTVTDVNGDPLDFGHGPKLERNRGIVVSNGDVHDELIEAIGRLVD